MRYIVLKLLSTVALAGSLIMLVRANPFPSLMFLILGVALSIDARMTKLERKLKNALGDEYDGL